MAQIYVANTINNLMNIKAKNDNIIDQIKSCIVPTNAKFEIIEQNKNKLYYIITENEKIEILVRKEGKFDPVWID